MSAATIAPAAKTATNPYRWVILLMVWLGYLLSFVDRLIWTSVGSAAANSYGLSLASLGLFVTAFYGGYVASTALTGFGADKVGPRLMLTAALIPLGLATFCFGYTTSITAGFVLQALMGLMAGADFSAGVKLIMAWFRRTERGRAMGIFMTATSLGVVVTNAVVPRLMQVMDWQSVYHAAGLLTTGFGVLCYLVLRDNPNGDPAGGVDWREIGRLVRNPQYVWVVIAGFGGVWGAWGFAIWANALMTKGLHFSTVTAGGIVASFGIIAIISKPCIGFLSDLLGGKRRILVMIDLFLFAALLLLTGEASTETQMWIVAPILGAAAFSFSPLQNAMAAEAGGGAIGTTIVPMVIGYGFQVTGSFEVAFAILAAGPLIGALAMIPVRDVASS